MSEEVILVDKHDNPIGLEEKMRAHERGLLHRAFSVFVFRKLENAAQVLLQQREANKYHCGGLWTNTCCSHPRQGETVLMAAERRLQEEMGFTCQLYSLGSFTYSAKFSNGLTEHEYDHVVAGVLPQSQVFEDFKFNPVEVQAYRWVDLTTLQADIAANPDNYTPWLPLALNVLLENISKIQEL